MERSGHGLFQVLSQYLSEVTGKTHENYLSGQAVSRPVFEHQTSRILSGSVSAVTFYKQFRGIRNM